VENFPVLDRRTAFCRYVKSVTEAAQR